MGDQLIMLQRDQAIPVEPTGTFATEGWMPGEWAAFSTTAVTFSGALCTIDRSDGTGTLAGYLSTGPQHNQPVLTLSDMWTTDQRQREGGDTHADWSAFDAGTAFELDDNLQMKRMGSRIVTLQLLSGGVTKWYVFETEDLAERTTPGTGTTLAYACGAPLYVSDRGRLTSEKEQLNSTWTSFVVVKYGNDFPGNYVIGAQAIM